MSLPETPLQMLHKSGLTYTLSAVSGACVISSASAFRIPGLSFLARVTVLLRTMVLVIPFPFRCPTQLFHQLLSLSVTILLPILFPALDTNTGDFGSAEIAGIALRACLCRKWKMKINHFSPLVLCPWSCMMVGIIIMERI